MPEEPSSAPVADEAEPTEDSPQEPAADESAEDSPEAQDQPSATLEKRFRDTQRAYHSERAKVRTMERELAYFRSLQERAAAPPGEQQAQESPEAAYWRQQYERTAWMQAEREYGSNFVEAYRLLYSGLQEAKDPASIMESFRSMLEYIADTMEGETEQPSPAPKAKPASPAADSNRSDVSPDPAALERKIAEARSSGNLGVGVSALLRKAGF